MEEHYPTLLMAQEQGAVQRGWVSDWLPTNAFNIREAHDLDTNQFMLRFAVPSSTVLSVPVECKPINPRSPPGPPFGRNWWPADVPASSFATHRHIFYGCNSFDVAFASNLGEGFVWSKR